MLEYSRVRTVWKYMFTAWQLYVCSVMRQVNPLEVFIVRHVVAPAWVRIYRDDPTGLEGSSKAWRLDGVWAPIFGDIRLCQPKGFERQWGGGLPVKMSRPKRASSDREGEWVCLNEKQGRPNEL